MSRQTSKIAIKDLINNALNLLELYKDSESSEEQIYLHESTQDVLEIKIPQHPDFVHFVNRQSVYYKSYEEMLQILKQHEPEVVNLRLMSRFQQLRRPSHASARSSSSKSSDITSTSPGSVMSHPHTRIGLQARSRASSKSQKVSRKFSQEPSMNEHPSRFLQDTSGLVSSGSAIVDDDFADLLQYYSDIESKPASNKTLPYPTSPVRSGHASLAMPIPVEHGKAALQSVNDANECVVISASDLACGMDDSKVLLIDLRPRREFEVARIKSKLLTNLDPSNIVPGKNADELADMLVLQDPAEFESFAQRTQTSLVCLYDSHSTRKEDSDTIRLVLNSLNSPHLNLVLLHGGFHAWQHEFPERVERRPPQFLGKDASVKQETPPLPLAPPPPVPPVHKHLPKLPPKEKNSSGLTPVPVYPLVPQKSTRADKPATPYLGAYPEHSAGLALDDNWRQKKSHDRASGVYPQPIVLAPPMSSSPHSLATPHSSAPGQLAPPSPPPHHAKNAFAKTNFKRDSAFSGGFLGNYSSHGSRSVDGYQDAPAKSALPHLRVPKLKSHGAQRLHSSMSPSTSPVLDSDSGTMIQRIAPVTSPSRQLTPPYVEELVPPHLLTTKGLKNLGNTCYMNCVIQCLASFPKLVEPFSDGSFERYINYQSRLGYQGRFATVFAGLMRSIFDQAGPQLYAQGDSSYFRHGQMQQTVAPYEMKRLAGDLRPDDFAGNEQQDCQEFLTFVLDGLHEDLNSNGDKEKQGELTEEEEQKRELMGIRAASAVEWERYLNGDTSLIVDLFQGQYLSRLQCMTCRHTSTTYNAFSSLSLPIVSMKFGQHASLRACFDEFVKPEILSGDDAWFCPKCRVKRRTIKTLQISRLPPILVIHLKRFKRTVNGVNKLETPVEYPLRGLDLTKYWPQSRQSELSPREASILSSIPTRGQNAPFLYDLRAVTLHHGSLKGGHYTAVTQKPGQGWLYFDDANVTPVKEQAAVSKNAYVLFYRRRM